MSKEVAAKQTISFIKYLHLTRMESRTETEEKEVSDMLDKRGKKRERKTRK